MEAFETVLGLLFAATLLSMVAGKINLPYPTLLACVGAIIAFVPGLPHLDFPPELILALLVAPVLLDAAHDASLRDLKSNWLPLTSLVVVAVLLTTFAVAMVARLFLPDLSWPAAIALGALLAPPDAVAAITVLEQVKPPYRIRKVLEGESLLNDASALLIYKLAVTTVAAGSLSFSDALPTVGLVVFGSAIAGWTVSWVAGLLLDRIEDAAASIVLQFVMTFGIWLLAERLGLSAVVTIVVFAIARSRRTTTGQPAMMRVASFATWNAVTFVLNVLAFMIIGLQIEPILANLSGPERIQYLTVAVIILAVVMGVRLSWVMTHNIVARWIWRMFARGADFGESPPGPRSGIAIGWSGMRGVVTLAAAMALPGDFPYRDFMQLTAFVVVLGTLILQGLTLRTLMKVLNLPADSTIEDEVAAARAAIFKAALSSLEEIDTPSSRRLAGQYTDGLTRSLDGESLQYAKDDDLRLRTVLIARQALYDLRGSGAIGDDAFRIVEQQLDWLELSHSPNEET